MNSRTNAIANKQAETTAVNLAATFRQRFKTAKSWKMAIWAGSMTLAAMQIVIATKPAAVNEYLPADITPYLIGTTILVLLLSTLGKHWKIVPANEQGHLAQQAHDHYCLGLGTYPSINSLSPATIHKQGESYKRKSAKDYVGLSAWWPPGISTLPLPAATTLCLFITYRWETQLRKSYQHILWGILTTIIVLLFIAAHYLSYHVSDIIILLLTPSTPFFSLLIDEILTNQQFLHHAEQLSHNAESLWTKVKQDRPETALVENDIESLHSDWQHYRREAPLIFEGLYWLSQKTMEDEMVLDSNSLIKEYLEQ